MTQKEDILITVVKLMNILSVLLMSACVIFRLVPLDQAPYDLVYFMMTCYLAGFAILWAMVEMKVILVYFKFLKSRFDKGVYIFIIGLLLYDERNRYESLIPAILVLIGLFNLLVFFIRDHKSEDLESESLIQNK